MATNVMSCPYHPCMVDLPTCAIKIQPNVGKYTSPTDAMGCAPPHKFNPTWHLWIIFILVALWRGAQLVKNLSQRDDPETHQHTSSESMIFSEQFCLKDLTHMGPPSKIPKKDVSPTLFWRIFFRIVGVKGEVWGIFPGYVGKMIDSGRRWAWQHSKSTPLVFFNRYIYLEPSWPLFEGVWPSILWVKSFKIYRWCGF